MTAAGTRDKAGALNPGEYAQAAVMAALSAATAIIAIVVPFAAGLGMLGTVPMGLLAYRYRLRVLVAAAVAGGTIAFLIAGLGGLMTVVFCAYIGGLTGIVKRRGRGIATVLWASVGAGILFGAYIIGVLLLVGRLRQLIFASMTANINGLANAIAAAPGGERAAEDLRSGFAEFLHYWPAPVMISVVLHIMVVTLLGWWALSRVLTRLFGIPDVHKLDTVESAGPVAPVPARLRDIRFRYPGTNRDALGPITQKSRLTSSSEKGMY
mgnify:FL=1